MAIVEHNRKRLGLPRIGSQSVPNSVNIMRKLTLLAASSFRVEDVLHLSSFSLLKE
jgi:hypothetical protein